MLLPHAMSDNEPFQQASQPVMLIYVRRLGSRQLFFHGTHIYHSHFSLSLVIVQFA